MKSPGPGGRPTAFSSADKIRPRSDLAPWLQDARQKGSVVVFTNGCFDILHAGHIHTLEAARSLGDILVVGVNSDASVGRIKGPDRPLVGAADRSRIVAALACVTWVTLFEEDTPVETIDVLRPSIHVKGADYEGKFIPERATVEQHGGVVKFVPLVPGRSSSRLLQALQKL